MLTEQLLAEINTLKDEIKNLNEIITVALNSSNACHFRAIEYQSQRDTLNSKNLKLECELVDARRQRDTLVDAILRFGKGTCGLEFLLSLAVKGGSHE
jgi:uncharacterized coiled-coil DUF342 family protein